MLLNELRAPRGSRKKKKRLGRGESSGLGKTSGKGHKGQKARSGGYHKVGFEGGQIPLVRRLPKRGFNNIFATEYAVINVADLEKIAGISEINIAILKKHKIVKKEFSGLKVLGHGELSKPFVVHAKKFSKSAIEKIEQAGGKAVLL